MWKKQQSEMAAVREQVREFMESRKARDAKLQHLLDRGCQPIKMAKWVASPENLVVLETNMSDLAGSEDKAQDC